MSEVPPPPPPPPPPAQPPMSPPPPPGYPPQPGPYMQPYGQPDAPNSMLSMVLGIVGLVLSPAACCCVFGVVLPLGLGTAAVILGFQARTAIQTQPGVFGGSGKALAGIVTGGTAIGIAIVLLVISLIIGASWRSIVNTFPTPT